MEEPIHPFCELFAQLGLPTDKAGIDAFIALHSPLPADVDPSFVDALLMEIAPGFR